jgi:16S rRNA (guanine(966)-N(2))-methyltransferase RsmD
MRIIGGEFRSRKLLTPRDDSVTRPIPDRVKESLFGLLRGHCENATVFDAFAGTGALGLEALSRGAERCLFVERSREIAEILQGNIDALGVQDRAEVVIGDTLGPGALSRAPRPLTLAFFDPPYPIVRDALGWKRVRGQLERIIDLLTPDGFAILRTPWPFLIEVGKEPDSPEAPERPRPVRRRRNERPRRGRRTEAPGEEWTEDAGTIAEWSRPSAADVEPSPEEAAKDSTPRLPGDLVLANAVGPETHTYASMAVHLYMRKPG